MFPWGSEVDYTEDKELIHPSVLLDTPFDPNY